MALVEDRLRDRVSFLDQVFGVVGVPEKFMALEARQELVLEMKGSCPLGFPATGVALSQAGQ